jgi:hypothetical protein
VEAERGLEFKFLDQPTKEMINEALLTRKGLQSQWKVYQDLIVLMPKLLTTTCLEAVLRYAGIKIGYYTFRIEDCYEVAVEDASEPDQESGEDSCVPGA